MPGPGNVDPPKKFRLFNANDIDEGFVDQRNNQPYIMDLVTLEILYLQTIPLEISIKNELAFAAVAAAGRNLPLYQYTGSESVISFSINWYANRDHKQDAWKKVKWLESISKNNGYSDRIHPVKFVFGELFKKSKFVIYSAETKISQFDRSKGMMPGLCTQEIELRKISQTNQLRSEMLDINT